MCKRISDGRTKTDIYQYWKRLNRRCSVKDCEISGVKNMFSDFNSFKNWSENNGFEKGKILLRVDPKKDYMEDNCRWVSKSERLRNKKNNRMLTIQGETKTASEWAEEFDIDINTFFGLCNNYEGLFLFRKIEQCQEKSKIKDSLRLGLGLGECSSS